MIRGLITAVRTLTTLRMPGRDAKQFSSSLYFFSFVGALLGFVAGGAAYLVDVYLGWTGLAAAAVLVVSVLGTGCLHIDGLADVCDSFGGSGREKRLAIMKDSSVGVYGVVGVVLDLLIKYVCLLRLHGHEFIIALPVVFALSRAAQVGVMVRMPYARDKGTAGSFLENAGLRHLFVAAVPALVLAWFMACQAGLALGAAAVLLVCVMRIRSRSVFGGITGDLIGFTNETVEIAGFLLFGVLLG